MADNNNYKLKAEMRPRDYKRDQTCTIVSPKTGRPITVPVELVKALREGKLERVK